MAIVERHVISGLGNCKINSLKSNELPLELANGNKLISLKNSTNKW